MLSSKACQELDLEECFKYHCPNYHDSEGDDSDSDNYSGCEDDFSEFDKDRPPPLNIPPHLLKTIPSPNNFWSNSCNTPDEFKSTVHGSLATAKLETTCQPTFSNLMPGLEPIENWPAIDGSLSNNNNVANQIKLSPTSESTDSVPHKKNKNKRGKNRAFLQTTVPANCDKLPDCDKIAALNLASNFDVITLTENNEMETSNCGKLIAPISNNANQVVAKEKQLDSQNFWIESTILDEVTPKGQARRRRKRGRKKKAQNITDQLIENNDAAITPKSNVESDLAKKAAQSTQNNENFASRSRIIEAADEAKELLPITETKKNKKKSKKATKKQGVLQSDVIKPQQSEEIAHQVPKKRGKKNKTRNVVDKNEMPKVGEIDKTNRDFFNDRKSRRKRMAQMRNRCSGQFRGQCRCNLVEVEDSEDEYEFTVTPSMEETSINIMKRMAMRNEMAARHELPIVDDICLEEWVKSFTTVQRKLRMVPECQLK